MDDDLTFPLAIGASILAFSLIMLGSCATEDRLQKEAMAHGVGEMVIDADGHTEFRWKTPPEKEAP